MDEAGRNRTRIASYAASNGHPVLLDPSPRPSPEAFTDVALSQCGRQNVHARTGRETWPICAGWWDDFCSERLRGSRQGSVWVPRVLALSRPPLGDLSDRE